MQPIDTDANQLTTMKQSWVVTPMFSEDQVPCPFALDVKSTYEFKGSTHVRVVTPKEADTKRFCH